MGHFASGYEEHLTLRLISKLGSKSFDNNMHDLFVISRLKVMQIPFSTKIRHVPLNIYSCIPFLEAMNFSIVISMYTVSTTASIDLGTALVRSHSTR